MCEWRAVALDEISAPDKNAIAIGPFGSRMKKDLYVEAGVPVIRGTNITGSREFQGDFVYISESTADELCRANVFEGDLVFPHRGAIGEAGIVPAGSQRYMLSTSLMKFTPDREQADPLFLYYFFRSSRGRYELLKNASQVGTPGIARPLESLRSVQLRLPPLQEQKEIAHILGTLDDKIELNRRMNRTLEAIARAIFKSWFVDFDPVHAKAECRDPIGMDPMTAALFPDSFQDSPLGKIPKGWEVGCLGDIARHHRKTIRSEAIESGMPYVALDDIPRGSITLNSWKTAEAIASSKSRFREGDVLFGKLRPYFHKVVVAPIEGICSTDIVVIRAKQEQWSPFVLLLCSSKDFVAYNTAVMTGTKMPRTNWRDMSKYEIVVPEPELVAAFSGVVAQFLVNTIRHSHECRRLAEVRDALLPGLLSGRHLEIGR